MVRSMIPSLQSQPIALARGSQGMQGVWMGTQWIGFGSSLCCFADHLRGEELTGLAARTEQGSDLGNKSYLASLLVISPINRPERQSGVYRARPPVPD